MVVEHATLCVGYQVYCRNIDTSCTVVHVRNTHIDGEHQLDRRVSQSKFLDCMLRIRNYEKPIYYHVRRRQLLA